MENYDSSGSGSGYDFPPSHDFGLDQDFFNWTDYAESAPLGHAFPLTNSVPPPYPTNFNNPARFQHHQHHDYRGRENPNEPPAGPSFPAPELAGLPEFTPEINQRLSVNLEQQFAHMLAMQDNNHLYGMQRPDTRRQSSATSATDVATPSTSTSITSSKPPKRKGRPRLDKDEDSKKSRRRAQLRSAQRGYKARKEQTISDLNERLNQIEPMVEEMSGHLLKFHDEAVASGLMQRDPVLGKSLVATLEKMLRIAKLVCGENGAGGRTENEGAAEAQGETPSNDLKQDDTPMPSIPEESSSELASTMPLSEDTTEAPSDAQDVNMDLDLTESFDQSPTPTPNTAALPVTPKPTTTNLPQSETPKPRSKSSTKNSASPKPSSPLSMDSLAQTFNPLITTRWPNTPKVPRNSFAGHLRYNCLLMAYAVLTTKYPDMQKQVSRIFRLHLPHRTKDEITVGVQKLLEDTTPGPFVLEEQDLLNGLRIHSPSGKTFSLGEDMGEPREFSLEDVGKNVLPYHEVESYLFDHRGLGCVGGWFVPLDGGGRFTVSSPGKQTGFSMFRFIKELIPHGFCTGTTILFPKVDIDKCVDVLLG